MNIGWIFAIICILIMFWSVEVRFKELYRKMADLKDMTEQARDKNASIGRQLEDWKRFLR